MLWYHKELLKRYSLLLLLSQEMELNGLNSANILVRHVVTDFYPNSLFIFIFFILTLPNPIPDEEKK